MNAARARAAGLGAAIGAAIACGYAWEWRSLAGMFFALDPGSTVYPCRTPDGATIVFCDFAQRYYPQGTLLFELGVPLPGFFYPAPFALLMRVFAAFSYPTAAVLWVSLGVACALLLYALPLWDLFSGSKALAAVYSALFITSLPLLHNFIWGQVSAPLALLVVAALMLYQRERRFAAAALLAVAASVKLYPALFVLVLLLRRDFKALAVFAGVAFTVMFALPLSVMGIEETIRYYGALNAILADLSSGVAANPYSSYIANAVSSLAGGIAPQSGLFLLLRLAGVLLIGVNLTILYLLPKWKVERQTWWAAALIFTLIPLAVGTCWIHYFVYLPLVQAFVLLLVLEGRQRWATRAAVIALLILPSVVLSNVAFFARFEQPDRFYRSGFPFWSSLLALLALYQQAWAAFVRFRAAPAAPGRTSPSSPALPR